jgi:hypothetical protein
MAAQPLKTYALALWGAQKTVAQAIGGVDIRVLPLQLRVVLVLTDLSVALVIQALVNAGIVTDAQVQAKLTEISTSTYKRLPDRLRAPDPEQGYDPPDPDLGA